MNKCSFSFAGIVLAASEIFVLELQGNNTASGVQGSFINPPSQPLYAEPLYEYSGGGFYNGWRIGFITYMLACQNGTACNDGEPCTTSDVCTNNVCAGAPVMCKAMDACHDAGTCDPQRACAGGAPKVCPPGGACSM
ncbi:MAG TPA: hypothetical protein VK459_14965, partial [Polyangiaceae bacterium]|nr:hypothetical protein [Polyangiaceae bacterium]